MLKFLTNMVIQVHINGDFTRKIICRQRDSNPRPSNLNLLATPNIFLSTELGRISRLTKRKKKTWKMKLSNSGKRRWHQLLWNFKSGPKNSNSVAADSFKIIKLSSWYYKNTISINCYFKFINWRKGHFA